MFADSLVEFLHSAEHLPPKLGPGVVKTAIDPLHHGQTYAPFPGKAMATRVLTDLADATPSYSDPPTKVIVGTDLKYYCFHHVTITADEIRRVSREPRIVLPTWPTSVSTFACWIDSDPVANQIITEYTLGAGRRSRFYLSACRSPTAWTYFRCSSTSSGVIARHSPATGCTCSSLAN